MSCGYGRHTLPDSHLQMSGPGIIIKRYVIKGDGWRGTQALKRIALPNINIVCAAFAFTAKVDAFHIFAVCKDGEPEPSAVELEFDAPNTNIYLLYRTKREHVFASA